MNKYGMVQLPAGTYYIGDPCYVIAEDKWSDFCDASFVGGAAPHHASQAVTEFCGYPMYANSTDSGDGCYLGSDGRLYGVDGGMLSVVPIELVSDMSEAKRLGSIVEFTHPFMAYYEKGTFFFDRISIPTGPEEEEEDETA
jgi:hypothetical protein